MKRWDCENGKDIENEKVDNFIKEIINLCKKHKLSIAHEDYGGAFLIESYKEANINWINSAMITDENEINNNT